MMIGPLTTLQERMCSERRLANSAGQHYKFPKNAELANLAAFELGYLNERWRGRPLDWLGRGSSWRCLQHEFPNPVGKPEPGCRGCGKRRTEIENRTQ